MRPRPPQCVDQLQFLDVYFMGQGVKVYHLVLSCRCNIADDCFRDLGKQKILFETAHYSSDQLSHLTGDPIGVYSTIRSDGTNI